MSTCESIILEFNNLFRQSHQTVLSGGNPEPYYQVDKKGTGRIYFREDFISSALHEVSHWCLAGRSRRTMDDYGYWYLSTRDKLNQAKFEAVEAKPQALEWIFSVATGIPFSPSADNLALPRHDLSGFGRKIETQLDELLKRGLPPRARLFADALAHGRVDYTQGCHYNGMYS